MITLREITINGYNVSSYYLGVVGEHCATKLIITPPSELICDDVAYYKVLFKLRNITEPVMTDEYYTYPMEIDLVQALTLNSSLAICIVAYDNNDEHLGISKKIDGFYFKPSDYNTSKFDQIRGYTKELIFDINIDDEEDGDGE